MTSNIPPEFDGPTIYSSLKVQSQLHLLTNKISNRLLCAPSLSSEEALTLNKPLVEWAATVPAYFQLNQPTSSPSEWYVFARSKIWWRYWNLQIILFRSILLRAAVDKIHGRQLHDLTAEDEQCKIVCLEAAHLTIGTIDQYIEQNSLTRLAAWYSL